MILKENTKEKIEHAEDAARACRAILHMEDLASRDREHFWIIGLNAKNTVKYVELCSLGTLTNSIVHPRETFMMAVLKRAASIIAVHNHPSGDVTPSKEDIEITDRLAKAGEILGIKLLDHIVIGNCTGYKSILNKGGE